MTSNIINILKTALEAELPIGTRVIESMSLIKRKGELIPISCNNTPSTCRPDEVEPVGMNENDVIFIWFGAEGETIDTNLGRAHMNEVTTTITMYVWYNGNRIAGNYCGIEDCVVRNVLKAILQSAVKITSLNVDYSVSALRNFQRFEPFAYFPYGFFSVNMEIKSPYNVNCEPCTIITKSLC